MSQPRNGKRDRESREIDQKTSRDRGEDAVIENARRPRQHSGEDAEATAVTHLEKLRHGQRPRLAEAIDHESRERHDQRNRAQHLRPPVSSKSSLVIFFEERCDADGAHSRHAGGDGEKIATCRAVGCQEVGHAFGQQRGSPSDPDQEDDQSTQNHPIQ